MIIILLFFREFIVFVTICSDNGSKFEVGSSKIKISESL